MPHRENTEAFLDLLFWTLERLSRPTFYNLTESFESWEFRTKIQPRLRSMARSGWVALEGRGRSRRIRCTERGRLLVLGGMDPVARWGRRWDGNWRLLTFDLPSTDVVLRQRLYRWLRSHRFGHLQQSVWVSPDPVDETNLPLHRLRFSPENLTVIQGVTSPPGQDRNLVRAAWNFDAINGLYSRAIAIFRTVHEWRDVTGPSPAVRRQWLTEQRLAWQEAIAADPLLPIQLCPDDYQGKRAFEVRTAAWDRIAKGLK